MDVETLVEQIRTLSPDEIRARLTRLDSEQRALRLLLRTRLTVGRGAVSLSRGDQAKEGSK